MFIEVYYEAPDEIIELNAEEQSLWNRYIEAKQAASELRTSEGWSAASELYNKADELYHEFFDLVSVKFSFGDLEVDEITEW